MNFPVAQTEKEQRYTARHVCIPS